MSFMADLLRPAFRRGDGVHQGVHDRVARSYRSDDGIIGEKTDAALASLAALWQDWPQPTRVVDLGVGDGDLLDRLRRDCPTPIVPTGVDISGAMLDKARERLPDMTPVRASAADASAHLEPGTFDVAFAHFILAYVPLPDVLREASRLLAPGGLLSLATSTNRMAAPLRTQIEALERTTNPRSRMAAWGARRGLALTNTPEDFEAMQPAFASAGFEVADRRSLDYDITFRDPDHAYTFAVEEGWCANAMLHPVLPPDLMAGLIRWGLGAFSYPDTAPHRIEVCLLRRV